MHGVAGPPVLSWLFNENLGSLMNSLESPMKICGSPMKKLGSPMKFRGLQIWALGFWKAWNLRWWKLLGSPMKIWGSPIRWMWAMARRCLQWKGVSEYTKFLPGLLSAINFIISYHILPYLILFRPRITWLKDGIELASFSEHEHVTLLKFWYLGKSF